MAKKITKKALLLAVLMGSSLFSAVLQVVRSNFSQSSSLLGGKAIEVAYADVPYVFPPQAPVSGSGAPSPDSASSAGSDSAGGGAASGDSASGAGCSGAGGSAGACE